MPQHPRQYLLPDPAKWRLIVKAHLLHLTDGQQQ